MMKILIILLFFLMPVLAKADPLFFETLYDVPVMDGLIPLADLALSFDKPDGRISEAGAMMGSQSQMTVLNFYDQTLVQLGWKGVKEGVYTREAETLRISFEQVQKVKIVKFLLEPTKKL